MVKSLSFGAWLSGFESWLCSPTSCGHRQASWTCCALVSSSAKWRSQHNTSYWVAGSNTWVPAEDLERCLALSMLSLCVRCELYEGPSVPPQKKHSLHFLSTDMSRDILLVLSFWLCSQDCGFATVSLFPNIPEMGQPWRWWVTDAEFPRYAMISQLGAVPGALTYPNKLHFGGRSHLLSVLVAQVLL